MCVGGGGGGGGGMAPAWRGVEDGGAGPALNGGQG